MLRALFLHAMPAPNGGPISHLIRARGSLTLVGRQRERSVFSFLLSNEILNEEIAFRLLFSFSIFTAMRYASDPATDQRSNSK